MMSDDERIATLLKQIETGGGGGHGREAAQAEIQVILARKLGQDLNGLGEVITSAKGIVGTRLTELNNELALLRTGLHESSEVATKYTRSLVFATWAMVVATILLAGIAWKQFEAANQAAQVQVDPEIRVAITHADSGGEFVVENQGIDSVIDISVKADTRIVFGYPLHVPGPRIFSGPDIPGREKTGWWQIPDLTPGKFQAKDLKELVQNAINLKRQEKAAAAGGQLLGINPKDNVQIFALVHLNVTYHRKIDHKRYNLMKTILVDSTETGKPVVLDVEMVEGGSPDIRNYMENFRKSTGQFIK